MIKQCLPEGLRYEAVYDWFHVIDYMKKHHKIDVYPFLKQTMQDYEAMQNSVYRLTLPEILEDVPEVYQAQAQALHSVFGDCIHVKFWW